jgi:hypothetical protein
MVVAPEAIVKYFWVQTQRRVFFTGPLYLALNFCRVPSSAPISRVTFDAVAEFPMGSHDRRVVT